MLKDNKIIHVLRYGLSALAIYLVFFKFGVVSVGIDSGINVKSDYIFKGVDVKPETITQSNFPTFAAKLRKILGHFSLFVASGIFTTWSLVLVGDPKKKFLQVLYSICVGAFIAFLSELFQLFTADRSGNFKDVGIDVSGYLVGVFLLILIYLIVKLIQKIKSNKKKKSS